MNKKFVPAENMASVISAKLSAGGFAEITVAGISMMPLFYDRRDSVILAKKDSYKKYDIIFYRRADSSYVLHRIVGVKNGAFVLCGDNQMSKEYPVYPEQIIGAVSAFVRKGRRYDISALWYRIYSHLWTDLFFLRPAMSCYIRARQKLKIKRKG